MLADAGWCVATAANGEQALQVAFAQRPPDVLVTDRLLGRGMSGPELIEAARRHWPHIRAVLISGSDIHALGLACGDQFLVKPFPASALVQLVAELARLALCPAET